MSLFSRTAPPSVNLLVNATHGSAISRFMPALWIMAFPAISIFAVSARQETVSCA